MLSTAAEVLATEMFCLTEIVSAVFKNIPILMVDAFGLFWNDDPLERRSDTVYFDFLSTLPG